ncbi:hypothetical protein [Formosa algae]|uniref:hypothetical protein n=1 Tax=Formosa algae TaxID=225843 RepID=UPI000CCE7E92|nr:hypothetical protein [Formosa algae]PNW26627.1 hypothetical protein BKP44_16285 [Formosa algae]
MKKLVTYSSGILLTLIYCIALYGAAQPLPKTFTPLTDPSEKHQDISSVTKSLFSLTSEPENIGISFGPPAAEFSKPPVFNHSWFPKLNERLVSAQISQYTAYQTNTLVNYRKHDSIFPFHYFW